METFPALMYAILPIIGAVVGVVIGGTLEHLSLRYSEERKHQQNLRTQAYVDFFRGVVKLKFAQGSNDKNKVQEFLALLTDAKVRISIYGSKEVINAIAEFERAGAEFDTKKGKGLFVNIDHAIRKDTFPKDQQISTNDISQLLFSKDLEGLSNNPKTGEKEGQIGL